MNKFEQEKLKVMSNAIRGLTIDAVERANSGHPGMPLGMSDVATVLFSKYLKFDPNKPDWLNRDRFVLSAGHGSMLLYALSYLVGYKDCSLSQLKKFRQLGSKTAGHPEYGLLKSIETTTGPLGQGLANGVGMALAEKILNEKYGKLVDHKTWVIVGDGCLMEGISQEAISFAGHKKLNKLIVLFDDNKISIDGSTEITCSDDQEKRFKASNWNTIKINGHDFDEINKAIKQATKSLKPTLICCATVIGYGSPNKSGKESSHGAPLGSIEAKLTKENLNLTKKSFNVPDKILNNWRSLKKKGQKSREAWEIQLKHSQHRRNLLRQMKKMKIVRSKDAFLFLENILKTVKNEATRKSSQNSLEFFNTKIENLIGGSADLTGSNLTKISSSNLQGKNTNYIHYGVREHLMSGAMNGLAVHGGFIPYGGTFLVFSDYCKNSIRLSAMMKQQIIYVFTHDSIGLGEDGPTHQPIEHLAGLRAIPNLNVFRPCDAIETFEAWEIAINSKTTPTVLALSRQKLPLLRMKIIKNLSVKGGYILDEQKNNKLTLIATGSEVSLGSNVQNLLLKKKIKSNLVSIPCLDLFDKQDKKYIEKVLGNKTRIIIEASSTQSWYKFKRENDFIFGIDKFGESGKSIDLFNYFGLTAEKIVNKIMKKAKL